MDPEPVPNLGYSSPDSQLPNNATSLSEQQEWQSKLCSLTDQHQLESLQQQQEHLEQLKQLQNQLLRDLSSDVSLSGEQSVQELWKSKHKTSTDTKVNELPILSLEEGDSRQNKEHFPCPPSSPDRPDHSFTETNVSVLLNESGTLSETQSLEFLQLPLPDNSLVSTSIVSPKGTPTKPHLPSSTPTKQYSPQLYSPDTHVNKSSQQSPMPDAIRSKSPVYKILGPRTAWEGPSSSQKAKSLGLARPDLVYSRLSQSPCAGSYRGEVPARASLLAKHTRHVEDLKRYYESELSSLRGQLEQTRPGGVPGLPQSVLGRSSPAQRQLKFSLGEASSPAKERVTESELWILQSENGRLMNSCSELQERLDEAERDKHVIEGQAKRQQQHVFEWQERCESSERMVSVLQERLDATRTQLHERERLTGQLNSDLNVTTEELVFWKDQKLQDVDKLDQLFHEFEVLTEENVRLLSMNSDLKARLDESGSETSAMRTSLDKYQVLEAQYKSTIHRLEDEVRHLEHINNRLHSQATHYDTVWHDESAHPGHVIRPPQTDLSSHTHHYSQKSPGQISHTRVEKSPGRATSRGRSTSKKSPGQVSGTPQNDTPLASGGSTSRPLTRRKWLETSIPGLLFGGGPETEEQQATSDSRLTSRMSPEANVVRPIKHSPKRTLNFTKGGNKERANEEPPVHYDRNESGIESALQAIRDGNVTSGEGQSKRKNKAESKSIEDRVREQMELVGRAEKRLVELQSEKEKLEGILQRTPRGRTTKQAKQSQIDMENKLEQVMREIGSVRMILRKHHAFRR